MPKHSRTKLLVDAPLQGALLCRVVMYWMVCLLVMLALVALQTAWSSEQVGWPVLSGRIAVAFGPAMIASLVLLPLVLFDALRFSHRFAGPLHRLTRELERLADGHTPGPVVFRKNDYWTGLATQFNRVTDEVHALRTADAPVAEHDETEQEAVAPVDG